MSIATEPKAVDVTIDATNFLFVPAVKVDHEGYQTGFYVNKVNVNFEDHLCIRKIQGNPVMPNSIKGEEDIPAWTYEAAEGFALIGRDLTSRSGCHRAELPGKLKLWRYVRDIFPPAHARKGGENILNMFRSRGYESVSWYVASGLSYAWILEEAGDIPTVDIRFDENTECVPIKQGNLSIIPVNLYGVSPDPFDEDLVKTLYNHKVTVQTWIRWFDENKDTAYALAKITGPVTAPEHEEIRGLDGWFLLSHPRPGRSAD